MSRLRTVARQPAPNRNRTELPVLDVAGRATRPRTDRALSRMLPAGRPAPGTSFQNTVRRRAARPRGSESMTSTSPGAGPAQGQSPADTLRAARDRYEADIRQARGGRLAAREYTAAVDGLLADILAGAGDRPGVSTDAVALVAIGGYGRRHLCLHSDIDLLILFDGRIAAAQERLAKALLHALWDLGFDVGHQVRQVGELEHVETDNPEFLVSVSDARFVAGDATVFDGLAARVLDTGSPWRAATTDALRELVAERHRRYNHTIYHLEPDIKEAPGGLRDLSAIRTLTALTPADADGAASLIAGRHDEALDEAEEFLLRIRSMVHLDNKRDQNILSHEHQETVAERFGAPGTKARAVEALMSVYFHHARIVSRVVSRVMEGTGPAPVPVLAGAVADNIERRQDGVGFIDTVRASLQPRTWLSVFQAAIDAGCAVAPDTLTFIERHNDCYTSEQFFPDKAECEGFLRFLKPRSGLYDRLSEMHENGLLGRMFPEFRKIYCRVIRDFYHKYTVDEHTFVTIRNLSDLTDPDSCPPSRRRFSGALAELEEPELIVLALLFHDVGKWTNKNHAEESVRMVAGPLHRLRIPPQAVRTVEFLIRHHLAMSQNAFRRDTQDPEVPRQLARLVGTEDRLRMLCLLTLVDIQGTTPETLTPWKEELLWHLYVDTYNHLTLGYGDEVIAKDEKDEQSVAALLAGRPAEITEEQTTRFLDGLPRRYLRLVDPGRVYDHILLSRDLEPDGVRVDLKRKDEVWELDVVTRDRPRIFSKICGVLSYFGMDILRGQAMSNRERVVLDLFRFVDADKFLALNESGPADLTRLLQEVLTGAVDLESMLKGREAAARARRRRVPNVVHFDHFYSDRYTVLEVGGANQWGLLHRISRVISEHDCDIDLVLISTEGDRATDVFHLTRNGGKLSMDMEHSLRTDLEAALGMGEVA